MRIGLIDRDPVQAMSTFDRLMKYLRRELPVSGIGKVSLFIAKDLDQLEARLEKGELDLLFTTLYPLMELEHIHLVPALVARQGSSREYSAVFFTAKESSLRDLSALPGKTLAFGFCWSTAGHAMAAAELRKSRFVLVPGGDRNPPEHAVRYLFAGEAVNRVFQVIRDQADAGVISSSEWEKLRPNERARLRVIHRTAPVFRLLGSFHPSFPPSLREAVEAALADMPEERRRAAPAGALQWTKFERLTGEDRASLQRFIRQLSETHDESHHQ